MSLFLDGNIPFQHPVIAQIFNQGLTPPSNFQRYAKNMVQNYGSEALISWLLCRHPKTSIKLLFTSLSMIEPSKL